MSCGRGGMGKGGRSATGMRAYMCKEVSYVSCELCNTCEVRCVCVAKRPVGGKDFAQTQTCTNRPGGKLSARVYACHFGHDMTTSVVKRMRAES